MSVTTHESSIKLGKTNLKSRLVEYIKAVIARRCPAKSKKIIFVSSVLAIIKHIREPDQELISKLDEVFKIAKYPDAYVLPMYIKRFIWSGVVDGKVVVQGRELKIHELNRQPCTEEETKAVAAYFADNAPSWLRYNSKEVMQHDVVLLMQRLLPAQVNV